MTAPHRHNLLFAFSSLGWPDADWGELAALAKAHHIAGIELRALRGGVDLPVKLQEEFGSPEEMATRCADSGVRVVSLDSSMRLSGADEKSRREVAELAPWADALGIPFIRVFDGGETGGGKDPAVREEILRELDVWYATRAERGFACDLMIETHWSLVDPKHCVALAEQSARELHLLWDICHTWIAGGVAPLEHWATLKPWVRHIHIKDAIRDASLPNGRRYVTPGNGEIPMLPLLERLSEDGFAGPVSLEWEILWHPELPRLSEALQSGADHGWW